jgi:hypothetical protein
METEMNLRAWYNRRMMHESGADCFIEENKMKMNKAEYQAAKAAIFAKPPNETFVLIDSIDMSDECVAAFRNGDAQRFYELLCEEARLRAWWRFLHDNDIHGWTK